MCLVASQRSLLKSQMARTPWLDCPDVSWRWCRFRTFEQARLRFEAAEGVIELSLPAALDRAVPRRRSEFLTGRLCATLALRDLGCREEVGRAGRAPSWPTGVSGSISHSGDLAMAVASRRHSHLGVDCEERVSEEAFAQVASLILTPQEWRSKPAEWEDAQFLTTVFSAKEAAYKALAPGLCDIPDFTEAHVSDMSATGLVLEFRGARIAARYAWHGRWVVTLVAF